MPRFDIAIREWSTQRKSASDMDECGQPRTVLSSYPTGEGIDCIGVGEIATK